MPTVPTLNRQIQTAPLQGGGFTTQSNQPVQATSQALGNAGKLAFDIAMKQKQDADNLALQSAVARIDAFESNMYDRENGFFARRGKDALNLESDVEQEFTRLSGEIEQGLANDTQRQAFAEIRMQRQNQIITATRKYEMRQFEEYANAQDEANIQLAIDLATKNAENPERVDQEVLKIADVVLARKERYGMSDEEASVLLSRSVSNLHLNVMSSLIEESPLAAKAYFERNKDELFGNDETKAQQLIEVKARAYEADDIATTISATGGEKLSEWLKQANEIEDPELRKMVRSSLEARWNDRQVAENERVEDAFRQVENGVDPRKQDWWLELSAQARSQLETRYLQVRNGIEPKHDDVAWLNFVDMGQEELASMSTAELYAYRSSFDDRHWSNAVTRWETARAAAASPEKRFEFAGFQTTEERIRNAGVMAGVLKANEKPSELKGDALQRYMMLNRGIEQQLEAAAYEKGGKLTATEEQQVIDNVVMRRVFIDDSWFGEDTMVPVSAIIEGDDPYVPVDQMPQQDQITLRNIIEQNGWSKGDAQDRIERAYPYWMQGNKQAAWQILKGNN